MIKKILLGIVLFTTLTAGSCRKEGLDIGIAKPVQIPDAPAHLMKKAERLPDITDPSFGGIMVDGAETDTKYNDVAIRLNLLIDYTICIQKSINEKKDISECLN